MIEFPPWVGCHRAPDCRRPAVSRNEVRMTGGHMSARDEVPAEVCTCGHVYEEHDGGEQCDLCDCPYFEDGDDT